MPAPLSKEIYIEIAMLDIEGWYNKQIAKKFETSPYTISHHKATARYHYIKQQLIKQIDPDPNLIKDFKEGVPR